MTDKEIRDLLEDGSCTLCTVRDGQVLLRTFGRGIGPALALLEQTPELLRGAEVYDTIVGKAAASLFILGGARAVYGRTMSVSARQLLTQYGVETSFDILAEQIINRQGTGLCPFEQAVLETERPEDCLPVIRETLRKLRN